MTTEHLDWQPTGYKVRVPDREDLDYLGQLYLTYGDSGDEWAATLTFYPGSGPYLDLLSGSFPSLDEAKAAVAEALAKHQAELAGAES